MSELHSWINNFELGSWAANDVIVAAYIKGKLLDHTAIKIKGRSQFSYVPVNSKKCSSVATAYYTGEKIF